MSSESERPAGPTIATSLFSAFSLFLFFFFFFFSFDSEPFLSSPQGNAMIGDPGVKFRKVHPSAIIVGTAVTLTKLP